MSSVGTDEENPLSSSGYSLHLHSLHGSIGPKIKRKKQEQESLSQRHTPLIMSTATVATDDITDEETPSATWEEVEAFEQEIRNLKMDPPEAEVDVDAESQQQPATAIAMTVNAAHDGQHQ